MTFNDLAPVSQTANAVTVKVQNKQEEQFEQVVGKIIEGVEKAPTREFHDTGKALDVAA